jgi:hypothetical protein
MPKKDQINFIKGYKLPILAGLVKKKYKTFEQELPISINLI